MYTVAAHDASIGVINDFFYWLWDDFLYWSILRSSFVESVLLHAFFLRENIVSAVRSILRVMHTAKNGDLNSHKKP
jgi:hypothetical protein